MDIQKTGKANLSKPSARPSNGSIYKIIERPLIYKMDEAEALNTLTAAVTKTAILCNASLPPEQAQMYAEELLEAHKHDHLETIILAMKNGRNGKYGKIYKFTYPLIKEWIANVLEEISIQREKQHQEMKKQTIDLPIEVDYEAYKIRTRAEAEEKQLKKEGQIRLTDDQMIERMIEGAALQFGTTIQEMRSECRERPCTDARAVVQYFQRMKLCWTFERIGDYWGQDHSSVIYNCKKVEDLKLMEA